LTPEVKARLSEKVQARRIPIVLDREGFRIDVGLIISRDPIFLHITREELELIKEQHLIHKKAGLYYNIPKELLEHSDVLSTESFYRSDIDNVSTHELLDSEGKRVGYSTYSKLFDETDPNIKDPKSI